MNRTATTATEWLALAHDDPAAAHHGWEYDRMAVLPLGARFDAVRGTPLLPPVSREWSTECALAPHVVALARTRARTHLTVLGWTGDIEDAVLVVSELVTNAVRHARVPGRVAWLRLAVLEDGGLLVDVSDPVEGFVRGGPAVPPDDDDAGGRGLHLVRRLGELSWFLRYGEGAGKTVRIHLRPATAPRIDRATDDGRAEPPA